MSTSHTRLGPPLWLSVTISTPRLPDRFDGRVSLGPTETFHDGWTVEVDTPTLRRIRRSLNRVAAPGRQLETAGWTLTRRWRIRPLWPERGWRPRRAWLVTATGHDPEELDHHQGWWPLPPQLGFEPDDVPPPIVRLCRIVARLSGYVNGPTDQLVDDRDLRTLTDEAADALAELAAGILTDAGVAADNQLATALPTVPLVLAAAPPSEDTVEIDDAMAFARRWSALLLAGVAHHLRPDLPDPRRLVPTSTTTASGAPVLVRFDPDAARGWLVGGAADRLGIDHSFRSSELSMAAGLENLLVELGDSTQPDVWTTHPAVGKVLIWRTCDDDGVDGGGTLTVDVDLFGQRIRLATPHQGGDTFTDDGRTSGVQAAVEALGHVAEVVNHEGARLARAITAWADLTAQRRFSDTDLNHVVNAAANDLLHVTRAGDEGLRDAVNLLANAVPTYLANGWHAHDSAQARTRLQQVTSDNYDEDLDTVLDWISAA